MALTPHPIAGKQKSADICQAFITGSPSSAVGHVFYGVGLTNADAWRKAKAAGVSWYYIDNSYFDCVRGQQFRVTKNRVQVDVVGKVSDGTRFAALGVAILPWQQNTAGHVVLIEQSPTFMSVVAEDPGMMRRTETFYQRSTQHRLVVREWSPDKPKLARTLAADLKGAWLLTTHSSAAAVEAVCAGIPAVVSPMSALWPIQSPLGPLQDDRLQVMGVLADNQFTLNELKDGTAWRALNP